MRMNMMRERCSFYTYLFERRKEAVCITYIHSNLYINVSIVLYVHTKHKPLLAHIHKHTFGQTKQNTIKQTKNIGNIIAVVTVYSNSNGLRT